MNKLLGALCDLCGYAIERSALIRDHPPNPRSILSTEELKMSQPTVAVIGASSDRKKFGNKSVRAHAAQGFRVFPVNPKGGEIEGLTVYKSVQEIPVERLDRVSLYVPPAVGLALVEEIAAKGCDQLWLNPGSDSNELAERARALGLNPIIACSIVDIGMNPRDFKA